MKKILVTILLGAISISSFNTFIAKANTVISEDVSVESVIGDGEKIELTPEEIRRSEEKIKLAEEFMANNNVRARKVNSVGTFMQTTGYNCGPATARNIIHGYVYNHGGTVPSEATLARALGTTTNGTNFGTTWISVMDKYVPGNRYELTYGYKDSAAWANRLRQIVPFTINKSKNYGIVANINHDPTIADNTIHPYYANRKVAHYVAVHGYDGDRVHISDSNNRMSSYSRLYTTGYYSLGKSTQKRGVIW